MKNFLKRITGIQALEEAVQQEENELREKTEAKRKELEEEELELIKKKDPKEYATRRKESWVAVLDVKVNEENVRNGFFELDWNEFFIQDLIKAGYGLDTDPEEEIVDRWFRDVVYNMLSEEGMDTDRGFGYINVVPISKGRSSVS